jgi:hypothetical protein
LAAYPRNNPKKFDEGVRQVISHDLKGLAEVLPQPRESGRSDGELVSGGKNFFLAAASKQTIMEWIELVKVLGRVRYGAIN